MDGMPHGYCLLWNVPLLWLHAGSDVIIAAAYFVIPVALVLFVRRRPDVPFNIVFWSFGAFILLCGASHLLSVYNVWVPNWWLSGGVKAATAAASVLTAGVLLKRLPQAIALPSPAQLQHVIDQLAAANALLRGSEARCRALARLIRFGVDHRRHWRTAIKGDQGDGDLEKNDDVQGAYHQIFQDPRPLARTVPLLARGQSP